MYVGLGCVWLGMGSSENASADAFGGGGCEYLWMCCMCVPCVFGVCFVCVSLSGNDFDTVSGAAMADAVQNLAALTTLEYV